MWVNWLVRTEEFLEDIQYLLAAALLPQNRYFISHPCVHTATYVISPVQPVQSTSSVEWVLQSFGSISMQFH